MTLKQILHFHHIYKHKNMTKAANEIHISQPALSASVKNLESFLGANLFKRVKNKLTITEEGEYFYEKSLSFLKNYDDLIQEMSDVIDNGRHIKIGIPLHISNLMIPIIFNDFHSQFEDIRIEVVEAGAFDLLNKVLDEEIQIAVIGGLYQDHEALNQTHLFSSKVCFCVHSSHPYAKLSEISFEDAMKCKIVMFDNSFYLSQLIFEKCNSLGITPNILFTTNQLSTKEKIVSKNIGCAFMLEASLKLDKDIVAIPLKENLQIDVGIVTKKTTHYYKHVQQISDFILDRLKRD